MDNNLENKIINALKEQNLSTTQIEEKVSSKGLEECSDKIVYALIRLKNEGRVKNEFRGKENIWSLN